MVQYSRLKRFLNQNKREVDCEGNLEAEYAEGMRSRGLSEAVIADKNARLKAEYERLKQLDETDPEQWGVYTAYDVIFTEEEKQQFNPDGSLRQEYQQDMRQRGYSEDWLEEKERLKKIEVENFEQLSVQYAQVILLDFRIQLKCIGFDKTFVTPKRYPNFLSVWKATITNNSAGSSFNIPLAIALNEIKAILKDLLSLLDLIKF
jgi:hypothetical protein